MAKPRSKIAIHSSYLSRRDMCLAGVDVDVCIFWKEVVIIKKGMRILLYLLKLLNSLWYGTVIL